MDENKIKLFNQIIISVSNEYLKIKNVKGIVVGGSFARGFSDSLSDIEMYVYYRKTIPSKQKINNILKKLNAKFTRSKNLHWYHPAWGIHTFFSIKGIKIELGYRDTNKIIRRINSFLEGKKIESVQGIHDCPFGHYESGLANCILECRIVNEKNNEIKKLKNMLNKYPSKLRFMIFNYYFEDALLIWKNKLLPAAKRDDAYHFNASLARIVRAIVICIFTINKTFFPGDKWNKQYLDRFKIKPKNYENKIKKIFDLPDEEISNKLTKAKILLNLIKDIKKLY
ncbi:MAG TPA: DUF4037 domain-containing protein [Candidatus Nanoarchaeia archaeon]|nr:DUF4037 domain-containing protein [Candidatus Nanoarchaeia archaeon]